MEEQKQNNGFFIPESQLEEIRKQAIERAKSAKHNWRQRGGWIVCTACTNQHAIRVIGGQKLTGIDEKGMPIVERRNQ